MADIIIKGMEMPEVCAECPFHSMPKLFMLETNRYSYISRCDRAPEEIEDPWRDVVWQTEHKESWCPLIQLPPHGRLIDADKLEKAEEWRKHGIINQETVNAAPTIIPADPEGGVDG